MKPQVESMEEIIRGLEGLELLTQWELSLARDLRVKAQAMLRATPGQKPPENVPPPRT
jgi:hypothetical protein